TAGGTCSPVLDFKSLCSRLTEDHLIVVVEKAGYGFSEDADVERDIDTVLSETREALYQAGFRPPYVLCPHSMSGIEALYWGQQYPEEVTAIIGLDMAVPAAYENMDINAPLMKLGSLGARLGLTRWIPGLSEGDAICSGTLTEEEKELYRALFYRNTLTEAMIREALAIKTSAALVEGGGKVDCPILMFASDGSGGTGYDRETWRSFQTDFAKAQSNAEVVPLDCPHYVHDYEYREIAERMDAFLMELQQETE
ncbi:MAG: alpha/beta hydrolase, partial [Oscillospiraceae bacterium]|nr:alpha/beta hydrolase [Oscillospiraceae bacterium]